MAGIIQQKIDVSLIPNPPVGSVLIQVDTDGILKYKIQSTNPSDSDVVGWMLINPIL